MLTKVHGAHYVQAFLEHLRMGNRSFNRRQEKGVLCPKNIHRLW